MRFTRLISSFAAIGAITMLVVAGCSSSDSKTTGGGGDDPGGAAGKTATNKGGNAGAATTTTAGKTSTGGSAGAATTSNGGASAGGPGTGGTAGSATTTPGGSTGTAGSGTGGTSGATLKDLIGALCDWEFRCCDPGEAKWQLGPTIPSAAACKSAFTYLLESDNTVSSPYPTTLPALLTTLGYSVDPNKVTENSAGIAQCIAQWNARACNAAPKAAAPAHCTGSSYGLVDPCDLTNLLKPKQAAGQPCNFSLKSTANDIECVAGTSCVNVGDPDNPNTATATCVTRGTAGAVCTSDAKCDYGFYCDTTGTGTCVAKGGPGATCAYKNPTNPVPNELAKQCMPNLTCNPQTKTCIEHCKTGYVCASDWQCPAGQSCIPISVGTSVDTFLTCSAQHTPAAPIPRCDTAEDCGPGYYCSANSCKAILAKGDTCAGVAGECPAGTYCTTGATRICDSYILNTKACTQSSTGVTSTSCDPVNSIGCVYKWDTSLTVPAATYVCSATLLANGERCGHGFDCASTKCEYANAAATFRTCIAGAAAGAACVATASATANNSTTCAAGLTCKGAQCVAQVDPGGSCESSTTAGQPDSTMCKNSSCNATQWKDAGAVMCTDTAVPVENGGTNVMCDGK